MPIRTHRGRAAVYRRLWGWPLRSPAHLIGTFVMVVAIIVAAGILLPKLLGDPGNAGATPSPTSESSSAGTGTGQSDSSTSESTLPTRLSEPLVTPTTAEPNPAALRVAGKWAKAWVHHPKGITSEKWLEGLRPYTTAEYLPVMRSVNPANIPATKVTGDPKATQAHTDSVAATVETDGPALSITVVHTDDGWLVANYGQAG